MRLCRRRNRGRCLVEVVLVAVILFLLHQTMNLHQAKVEKNMRMVNSFISVVKEALRKMDWNALNIYDNGSIYRLASLSSDDSLPVPDDFLDPHIKSASDVALQVEVEAHWARKQHLNKHERDPYKDKVPHSAWHPECKTRKYSRVLPSVTVVIPFCLENPIDLMRRLSTIIIKSPKSSLKEVIYVKDMQCSNDISYTALTKWLKKISAKVEVIRLTDGQGRVEAMRQGARNAHSDILVFLEAQSEVTEGWLPPLLEVVKAMYRSIVVPAVDYWEPEGKYIPEANMSMVGFDWHLHPRRMPLPTHETLTWPFPHPTPLIGGGVFAISRRFFKELGYFDPEISSWGAAHLELSLKSWMCGGRILEVTCSRVLQVHPRPNIITHRLDFQDRKGYGRVVNLWMADNEDDVFRRRPDLWDIWLGDLKKIKKIQHHLGCYSFSWYLNAISDDMLQVFPVKEPKHHATGQIYSISSEKPYCIAYSSKDPTNLFMEKCNHDVTQLWVLSWREILQCPDELLCWEVSSDKNITKITLEECSPEMHPKDKQIWKYNHDTHQIVSGMTSGCLQNKFGSLHMVSCDPQDFSQKWSFDTIAFNNR